MSTVTSSYRIRAYPNGAQRRLLDRWLGATRWLWNTALEIRSAAYRECGLRLTGNDLARWLTQWKRTTGHEWLAEIPATALTQCLRDQDHALKNFFAHRASYPRYKCKQLSGSLRFQDVSAAAWAEGIVKLPKLGALRLAESKELLPIRQRSIGVDLGITHLAILSNGEKIPNPRFYHKRLRYLRQQQRCLARRQKDSRRREKQRLRVARAHARVRHARHAAVHQLTSRLVYEFDLICIEDLNVRALSRGLHARAMQEVAFGEIRRQLTYKSQWYGKILETVDRWYPSSKTCSVCQHTLDELRLDERYWHCPKCGTYHDRDINAARNLLRQGLRQLAGCDDRDLRVDARDSWPEEIPAQVLAVEARSGHRNRACREQVWLR